MKREKIYIFPFAMLILFIILNLKPITAKALLFQTQTPKRDPQIVRELLFQNISLNIVLPEKTKQSTIYPDTSILGTPPSWSQLIFQAYRDGRWNLYSIQPDGTGDRKITSNKGANTYPAYKKNGQLIAFANDRSDDFEIYTINKDGSNLKRITQNNATDTLPTWSPNGELIAFQSDREGNHNIYVMDENGNNIIQLTNSSAYDGEPSWSPVGDQIVFVSNRTGNFELWVMNSDGTKQHQITTGAVSYAPDWSPKGDQIAFSNDSDGNGFYEIWLIDPEGGKLQTLDFPHGPDVIDLWSPSWSPDGNWLAFISTYWGEYQNQWFWDYSRIKLSNFSATFEDNTLIEDRYIMRVDWAANDLLPPNPCSVTSSAQNKWSDIPVQFTAQDQGASGIAAYDGQFRKPGNNWQELVSWIRSNGAIYSGFGTGQVEFRCRAYDWAGNVGPWSETIASSSNIDAIYPSSSILSGEQYIRGNSANVTWYGSDQGSGIEKYNIYSKDGENGNWTKWLSETPNNQGIFTGETGHKYFFRSQAYDQSGHTQSWQPNSQRSITFYSTTLTATVTDQRGNLIPSQSIDLQPAAINEPISDAPGIYTYYFTGDDVTHLLDIAASGFVAHPPAKVNSSQDSLFNSVLLPTDNHIIDGGFESGTLNNWSVLGDGAMTISTTQHTGEFALQLSHVTSNTTIVSQLITIDSSFHQPTLSFLYRVPTNLNGGTFKVNVSGAILESALITNTVNEQWTPIWMDLSPFQSQDITLTFELNEASGIVLIDDVAIGSWNTPIINNVSPTEWIENKQTSLTISGENFLHTPEIYLDDIQLTNVVWVSSTLITANIPSNIIEGEYELQIINPGGASSKFSDTIQVKTIKSYLPLIFHDASKIQSQSTSDWLMFGYDATRTGYNQGDNGASRYSLAWEVQYPSIYCYDGIPLVIADNILISGDCGSNLIALNAETGDQLWLTNDSDSPFQNSATISNGFVYWGLSPSSSNFHALDLYTGSEYWQTSIPNNWSPIIADHRIFSSRDYDNGLAARNASSGSTDWSNRFYMKGNENGNMSYYEGILYSWVNGIFRAINPTTGGIYWSLSIEPYYDGWFRQMPVISNGIAIVGMGTIPTVCAIDINTHQLLWTAIIDASSTVEPFFAIADNVVYALFGKLYAYDLYTGELLWDFPGNSAMYSNPIITKNYIYVSTDMYDPHTYVIDRNTHQLVWEIDKGGYIAVANGFLYINYANDSKIYAYRAQDP